MFERSSKSLSPWCQIAVILVIGMYARHSAGSEEGTSGRSADPAETTYEFGPFLFDLNGLADPSGVAVDGKGNFYVADTGSHRILLFDRAGKPVRSWGSYGREPGEFVRPAGLALFADGTIYVADTGNHRVQVFDANGTFVRAWGSHGSGKGEFNRPTGLAVDSERIYVADSGNDRIQVFDHHGSFLSAFGQFGQEDGQFNRPLDVAVGPDGAVFVADSENNRVQRFDTSGEHVSSWGDWGPYFGLLATPAGIAFHHGAVYVADSRNHRIQSFAPDGTPRYQWGVHALRPREGAGKLHYPTTLALAPDGKFAVVCETFENRCQVFAHRTDESEVAGYDESLIEVGALSHYGQRCHLAGKILVVTEPDTHSVLVFNTSRPTPVLINRFGGQGTRFGRFIDPTDVYYSEAESRIYVTDAGNRRLQIFSVNADSLTEVKFDPFLTRFAKCLDLSVVPAALGQDELESVPSVEAIARHDDGRLFLADSRNAKILVLDQNLAPMAAWGTLGDGPGEFGHPTDIALSRSQETVYVVDADNHRVQAFDLNGNHRFSWGDRGTGDGEFVRPFGVAAGNDGFVYVTDTGADRVRKFDERGRFVGAWGARGLGPGELFRPAGIVQADDGRLIVMDFGNHRGMAFAADGGFIQAFGARLYVKPTRSGKVESESTD